MYQLWLIVPSIASNDVFINVMKLLSIWLILLTTMAAKMEDNVTCILIFQTLSLSLAFNGMKTERVLLG